MTPGLTGAPALADLERGAGIASLRRRLDRLGGLGGGAPRPPAPPAAGSARADGSARVEASARSLGFESVSTGGGAAWVRRVDVDLGPFLERAGASGPAHPERLLRLAAGAGGPVAVLSPDECAVLDVETLGLRGSGVLPFLIGLGVPRGRRLDIDQILLVDPGAEVPQLLALLDRLGDRRLLVTYNGRGFDLPVLRARCVVNRLGGEQLEARLHCDLLGPVRRLFRDRLGACTLRQAELSLLGFERDGDAPGAEAPLRYRAWLRGADTPALRGVVLHNQLDLCATMVLAGRLADHVAGRLVEPVHPADRYRLAVHLERLGVGEGAEAHYRAALAHRHAPWDGHAAHRLAGRLRRGGAAERAEALELLRALWRRDRCDLRAGRALCILAERQGDLEAALGVAEEALAICARLGDWRVRRFRGAPSGGWEADWERRRARLGVRLARRNRGAGTALLAAAPRATSAQAPPGALEGDGAAGAAEVFAHWAQGICQSPSPSP